MLKLVKETKTFFWGSFVNELLPDIVSSLYFLIKRVN